MAVPNLADPSGLANASHPRTQIDLNEFQIQGNGTISRQWFTYGTTASFGSTVDATPIVQGTFVSWNTVTITGLVEGTTYYFRAHATNPSGQGNSPAAYITAVTHIGDPSCTTDSYTPGYTHILVNATASYAGGPNGSITGHGIRLYDLSLVLVADSGDLGAIATGAGYSYDFTGLPNGTAYYAQAYVTNSVSTQPGNALSVGTIAYTAPSITNTSTPWAKTTTTITPKATATSDGSAGDHPVTAGGFVYAEYGTNATPTIGGTGVTQVAHGSAPTLNVEFSDALNGLTPGRVYAVRAYATNDFGTTYTSVVQIVTAAFTGFAQSQTIPTPTMRNLYTIPLTGKAETAAIPSPPLSSAHVSGKAETALFGTVTWRMRVNPSGKAETARFGVPVMLRTGVASVTVIQTATSAIGSANTSQNCTVAALTVHSLVVVVVYLGIASAGVSGVTDNASGGSSTYQRAQETHGHHDCELWYCDDAKAGATTITVAHSSATCGIIVREYSGVSAGASLDKATSASADSGSSANFSTGNTAITTQNEELVIAAYSYETNV